MYYIKCCNEHVITLNFIFVLYLSALAFCDKNLNGTIPDMVLSEDDKRVLAKVNREYTENLEIIKWIEH